MASRRPWRRARCRNASPQTWRSWSSRSRLLELATPAGTDRLVYEGLRERYLPEVQFRGRHARWCRARSPQRRRLLADPAVDLRRVRPPDLRARRRRAERDDCRVGRAGHCGTPSAHGRPRRRWIEGSLGGATPVRVAGVLHRRVGAASPYRRPRLVATDPVGGSKAVAHAEGRKRRLLC